MITTKLQTTEEPTTLATTFPPSTSAPAPSTSVPSTSPPSPALETNYVPSPAAPLDLVTFTNRRPSPTSTETISTTIISGTVVDTSLTMEDSVPSKYYNNF